jgi:spore photoproduct lyase
VEPTFFANLDDLESELGDFLSSPQATGARVYLAHLGEPVPFEPFTRLAARVAPLFPGPRDAVLEIRTKSDQIEALAPAFGPGTVLSWTLTPAPFDRRYEPCAPPTESRVLALARAASRGARVAVRLDPLITRPGWEEAYAAMLAGLAKTGAPLQDVQIGVLRFTPAQRSVLESTEMGRELLADELLRGPDGKVKLHAPRRIPVLRRARDLVRAAVGPDVPISLCMEPPWVTRAVALPRTTNVSDV